MTECPIGQVVHFKFEKARSTVVTGTTCQNRANQRTPADAQFRAGGAIRSPRNTKPAYEGGPVSRQTGEYRGVAALILPENLNPMQEPFLAAAELCLKSCAPLRRDLIPNGEAMLAEQFHAAAAAARNTAAVDEIARLTWRAHAEGHILDAEAEAISEALQGRRAAFAARRTQQAVSPSIGLSARRRPTPRSPDRQASLERRRRQAASGAVPPALAARFTTGELAVLTVIARQCQRAGVCSLPIDAIAALAGVSRTTVQNALGPPGAWASSRSGSAAARACRA